MDPHRLELKVYLEDTDAIGIVYHANYLKYMERSRSDMLESGASAMGGRQFVVHEMQIKFLRPARLGDRIEVRTTARRASDYRITFSQAVLLKQGEIQLASAEVQVTCVDSQGNLTEIPEKVSQQFALQPA